MARGRFMPGVRFHVTPSLAPVQFLIELFNFLPDAFHAPSPAPLSPAQSHLSEVSLLRVARADFGRWAILGGTELNSWYIHKTRGFTFFPIRCDLQDGTDFRLWAATSAFWYALRDNGVPFPYSIPESVYIAWFTHGWSTYSEYYYSGWMSSVINGHRVLSILSVPSNFSDKISTTKILTITRKNLWEFSTNVLRVFGTSSLNYY